MQNLFDDDDDKTVEVERTADPAAPKEPFILADHPPESAGETIRRTGLAWSAGIAFFGAIVFMLFLGWLADLLLGSSPWGVVGGIVLGSIIGFLQFFRITSRIFGPPTSSTPAEHPLLPQTDERTPRRDRFDDP